MTLVAVTSADEARALTDRIKVGVDEVWGLIVKAYQTRADQALGYDSWDTYCQAEFGTSRLRLPMEERRRVVSSMREIGMSTRMIVSATGTSKGEVYRALKAGAPNGAPDPEGIEVVDAEVVDEGDVTAVPEALAKVVGLDGKEYNSTPKPTRKPSRPPLPPRFRSAAGDLTKVVGRIEQLASDDRFQANRVTIADECVPTIRRAVDVLQDLLEALAAE